MKKRLGFVSNSSSTSFYFSGNVVDVDVIQDEDILEDNYYFFGKGLGDGQDVMKIKTWEELMVIKCILESGLYDVDVVKESSNVNVEVYHQDNCSCNDVHDLIETYLDYDEKILNKIKQKLLNKKIKKIKYESKIR